MESLMSLASVPPAPLLALPLPFEPLRLPELLPLELLAPPPPESVPEPGPIDPAPEQLEKTRLAAAAQGRTATAMRERQPDGTKVPRSLMPLEGATRAPNGSRSVVTAIL
jgi:hypothetical protein